MVSTLDNFTNIGKAVLIQALGLQKNYQEVLETTKEVIDYNNEDCVNCKWKEYIKTFNEDSEIYKTACSTCDNCPHKKLTTINIYKKVYFNEKNKYGYKPRLKNNAIKLLLLLHFNTPDSFGILRNIDIRNLANFIGCSYRTIFNNLNTLQEYKYISFCKLDTYTINLCLCDYDTYYLPAQKGGRGFIVMSKELLQQLINLDNLVSLRIHLRELIELDTVNTKDSITTISKKITDIKRLLPEYCKPCIIKNSIKNSSSIFNITIQENDISFEIKDKFNCKLQKQLCFNEYINKFDNFVKEFNNAVSAININSAYDPSFSIFFNIKPSDKFKDYELIKFKDYEIEDLALLAVQYSYDIIIDAYSTVYQSYILEHREIKNLGGLVRTLVRAKFNNSLTAA